MNIPRNNFLSEILETKIVIDVVDVGANPIDEIPPYTNLLKSGHVNLVGFEPNPDALAKLIANKGENETYFPFAIADGNIHEFKICKAPGMSSLLEPNTDLLNYFHGFPDWGQVLSRKNIETVRLDEVKEIKNMDYIKIDIQGGELLAFKNATRLLSNCCVIHTEVEFLPMYIDQPLFSEVEIFLRQQGFLFHRFQPLASRVIQPLLLEDDIYREFVQTFWADAIFVRDFTQLKKLTTKKLLKLACILHDIYKSWDLVLRTLLTHDELKGTNYADIYLKVLTGENS